MVLRWFQLTMLPWILLALVAAVVSDGIDDTMTNLAKDIGDSFTSISQTHKHKVDWMFVVDHGGFDKGQLHLEYSKHFIQQLASHLYISPMYSQAGVVTYGSTASAQIPLDVQNGNQCDFNTKVNKLTLIAGQSDMNKALEQALYQHQNRGRGNAHKVTVLVTTAGWENIGDNPYSNLAKVKNLGTLMVVVLVFDRAQSITAPVVLSFASDRTSSVRGAAAAAPSALSKKYAFELEAKRGNLRRLYRHFLLATRKKKYLSLQVPSGYCPTCQTREACVCDVDLYDTYHCEIDIYPPLITVECPADQTAYTEAGKPYATVHWLPAQAVDYSSSMQSEVIIKPDKIAPYGSARTGAKQNVTHVEYLSFLGKTMIIHKFSDIAKNSINCSFTITVADIESPKILNCPLTPIYANTTGSSTKNVYWTTIQATDNSLVTPTSELFINGIPKASGTRTFAIGTSAVRIIFSDESGNAAPCEFNVIVNDYEPPTVTQCDGPNSTIYSSDTQAYVNWIKPEFVDNSGSSVKITGDKIPGYFRIGQHTVTYSAADVFGNSRDCQFTFTVRGYPCPQLPAPYNGAIICDNAVPGAACQIFCEDPFDFEALPGQHKLPEKYSCVGTGKWYPTDKVPHCVVRQGSFKKLTTSYYYSGKCSNINVSEAIKTAAVEHYEGFVEGAYFKEAWGRKISSADFNNPRCGAPAAITTPGPTTTTTTLPTTTPTTTTPLRSSVASTPIATLPTRVIPTTIESTSRATTVPPRIGGSVVKLPSGVNVIGRR